MTNLSEAGGQRIDTRSGRRRPRHASLAVLWCRCGLEVLVPAVDAFDPGREVIRFDVPGVGGSPVGPLPYGFAALACLVHRVLGRLGYHHVDVLGLSLAADWPRSSLSSTRGAFAGWS